MAVAGVVPGVAQAAAAAPPLIDVTTPAGRLMGHALPGALRFLGIPYAEPPVGQGRFMAAQPLAPWRGLRPALRFGPAAMQWNDESVPTGFSDDCLFLNVWTPKSAGPHPVYVWIHGGGNVAGNTTSAVFDGERMAARGVVVVSLGYRVGAWGFMDVSEWLGERYAGSGNNGLRDLVLGLRWVRENIAALGGDPRRVTIGGHSAGAKDVAALLAAPQAAGLFQRAISISGGGQTSCDLADARAVTDRMMAHIGVTRADPSRLLNASNLALLTAQTRVIAAHPRKYPFRAVVDGVLLPKLPLEMIADGASRQVPLLIGWARDDAVAFGPSKTPDGSVTREELSNIPLAEFQAVQAAYRTAFPAWDETQIRYRSLSAEEYGIPTLRIAESIARHRGTAYLYRYDLPLESGGMAGYAPHGSELSLVFDNLAGTGASAVRARVGAQMSQAWIDFIRGGSPGWAPYELQSRPVMRWDEQAGVVPDLDGAERLVWRAWAANSAG